MLLLLLPFIILIFYTLLFTSRHSMAEDIKNYVIIKKNRVYISISIVLSLTAFMISATVQASIILLEFDA